MNGNQALRLQSEVTITPGSIWRHYKGAKYEALGVACLESDPSKLMVIYRSVKTGEVWTRPIEEWYSSTEDYNQKRFVKLGWLASLFARCFPNRI